MNLYKTKQGCIGNQICFVPGASKVEPKNHGGLGSMMFFSFFSTPYVPSEKFSEVHPISPSLCCFCMAFLGPGHIYRKQRKQLKGYLALHINESVNSLPDSQVIRRSLMWERARVSTTRKLYQGVVLGVSVLACALTLS